MILTDESPHSTGAHVLREAVADGARAAGSAEVVTVPDRTDAITMAVSRAEPGDIVLVAGRGHDPFQVFDKVTTPFDDRVVLRSALRRSVR